MIQCKSSEANFLLSYMYGRLILKNFNQFFYKIKNLLLMLNQGAQNWSIKIRLKFLKFAMFLKKLKILFLTNAFEIILGTLC